MMSEEKRLPGRSIEDHADWPSAYEFLEAGQYEQVAEILDKAADESERRGDVSVGRIIAAAYRICLACSQSRRKAEWHEQAIQEATRLEHELRQQLQPILDLVSGREAHATQEEQEMPRTAPPSNGAGLRQGVRGLPERTPLFSSSEQQTRNMSCEVPSLPHRDNSEISVPPLEETVTPVSDTPPSLAVYCLGSFRVYQDDQRIERWPGNKCKHIFKYMIINRERLIHQEIFMDLFWQDVDPESARRNLYQAIYSLRKALQTGSTDIPYILCDDSCYYLNPDVELWVDSEALRMHEQDGRRLERAGDVDEAIKAYELAENLYQGNFLAEDIYEDWTVVYREDLRDTHLEILDRLSQLYFDQWQLDKAISYCHKILAQDNCREDAHRRLMRCHLHQGQRHLALRQYDLCVEALKRELDVPPMPATLELHQRILHNHIESLDIQEELRDN